MIHNSALGEDLGALVRERGFMGLRLLLPFVPRAILGLSGNPAFPEIPPHYLEEAPALLVTALPHAGEDGGEPPYAHPARIAPFARRNYYAEAVSRLKDLARLCRERWGKSGEGAELKRSYRIYCNSPLPEKPIAALSGLASLGKNRLMQIPGLGSRFILACMTLPRSLLPRELQNAAPAGGETPGLEGWAEGFPLCQDCAAPGTKPPCAAACPTGALDGRGGIALEKCIQWYAAGHGREVPPEVAAHWGGTLYGCSRCQEACPANRNSPPGVSTTRGALPPVLKAEELLALDDGALRAFFKGSALDIPFLKPAVLRRNLRLCMTNPS